MGRNGTKDPIFGAMVQVINKNKDNIIPSSTILLGNGLGRNAVTHYLYRLVKAGYLKPIDGPVKDPNTQYLVAKEIPEPYTSVSLKAEIDAINASKNKNSVKVC